jgi:hypothetical protein
MEDIQDPFAGNMAPVDPELAVAQERALAGGRTNRTLQKAQEQAAMTKVRAAIDTRDPQGPAKPTGVVYQSQRTGTQQHIFDDGSLRNPWKRTPGLSGRQFRKLL